MPQTELEDAADSGHHTDNAATSKGPTIEWWIIGTLIAWSVIFVLIVVPVTTMYAWGVSRRPVVIAHASNQHVKLTGGGGKNHAYKAIFATVDFDRPSSKGSIRCHIEDYYMGPVEGQQSNVLEFEMAVRSDTCSDPVQLPIEVPIGIIQWILVYILGCIIVVLSVFFAASGSSGSRTQ